MTIQSLPNETLPVQTDYAYDPTSKRLQTITLPGTTPVTITYSYFGDASPTTHADASNQIQGVLASSPGKQSVTLNYLRDYRARRQ
jgi:hypothetical protein